MLSKEQLKKLSKETKECFTAVYLKEIKMLIEMIEAMWENDNERT